MSLDPQYCQDLFGVPIPAPCVGMPCCNFDSGLFLNDVQRAALMGAPLVPGAECDPKYWTAPVAHPDTGIYDCQYADMGFGAGQFINDLLTGNGGSDDVYDSEYWSDRFAPENIDISTKCMAARGETWLDIRSRCPPPPIWAGKGLPSAETVRGLSQNVSIAFHNGFFGDPLGSDGCIEELIRTAWALLRLNYDLVVWSQCVVGRGELRGSRCMADLLAPASVSEKIGGALIPRWGPFGALPTGAFGLTQMNIDVERWIPFDQLAWANPLTHTVNIDRSTDWFDKVTSGWCMDGATGASKLCAALQLAVVLFHEMQHICGHTLAPQQALNDSGDCEFATLADSVFGWAMLQRYSGSSGADCCNGPDIDALFYSDEGETINSWSNC